jgi:glucokinase
MKIAIGLDIGGTNTKIVLASEKGNVLIGRQISTPSLSEKNPKNIDDLFVTSLKDFLSDESTKTKLSESGGLSCIAGIGIGVAGLIDRKRGIVLESPNIKALNGIKLRERFEKEFSMPVVLENDANIYAYGETLERIMTILCSLL